MLLGIAPVSVGKCNSESLLSSFQSIWSVLDIRPKLARGTFQVDSFRDIRTDQGISYFIHVEQILWLCFLSVSYQTSKMIFYIEYPLGNGWPMPVWKNLPSPCIEHAKGGAFLYLYPDADYLFIWPFGQSFASIFCN